MSHERDCAALMGGAQALYRLGKAYGTRADARAQVPPPHPLAPLNLSLFPASQKFIIGPASWNGRSQFSGPRLVFSKSSLGPGCAVLYIFNQVKRQLKWRNDHLECTIAHLGVLSTQ